MIRICLLFMLSFNSLFAIEINETRTYDTDKSLDDFHNRINALHTLHKIDNNVKISVLGKKIKALDLISSQTRKIDNKIILSLEFRPLPTLTVLDKKHYPYVVLVCNATEDTISCKSINDLKEKFRVIEDFEFKLIYFSDKKQLSLDYSIHINDKEFAELKTASMTSMLGRIGQNDVLNVFVEAIFSPKKFFKEYIDGLYQNW